MTGNVLNYWNHKTFSDKGNVIKPTTLKPLCQDDIMKQTITVHFLIKTIGIYFYSTDYSSKNSVV